MTLDPTKVRVAVTGAVLKGLTSATAPTGTGGTTTGFTDLGLISEDGVTETHPSSGDRNPIKAWQNGMTVRIIRSPSDDNPTFQFQLMETRLEVIELYYGTTVSQTATEGSFEIDSTDVRGYNSFIIDVVDGAELIRTYVPQGYVSEVGDKVYQNGVHVGYEVTIEAERDSAKGFNAKCWMTALKS